MALLGVLSIILNAVKGGGNLRKRFVFGTFVWLVGQISFIFWAAVVVEIGKQIDSSSILLNFAVVSVPFMLFTGQSAKTNKELSRKVREGNYEDEISAILLNGSGMSVVAFIVFCIWQNLNNYVFYNAPLAIVDYVS